jgi:hypothetical protein
VHGRRGARPPGRGRAAGGAGREARGPHGGEPPGGGGAATEGREHGGVQGACDGACRGCAKGLQGASREEERGGGGEERGRGEGSSPRGSKFRRSASPKPRAPQGERERGGRGGCCVGELK